MVINVEDLDLSGVLFAIAGMLFGVMLSSIVIGVLLARLSGRPVGVWTIGQGLVVAVALLVDVIVVSRILSGEVTGWDVIWAVALGGGAVLIVRRAVSRRSTYAATSSSAESTGTPAPDPDSSTER